MKPRVAINGLGRIGKLFLQQALDSKAFQIVGVNDPHSHEEALHLLRHDTNYGQWGKELAFDDDTLVVDDQRIAFFGTRNLSELPWKSWEVDIVVETTGAFRSRRELSGHLEAGAQKVVLSAPSKDALDLTVVMGVNDHLYSHTDHHLLSNGSCTTNCMAPVISVLHEVFGLEQVLMTTVHSTTNDQKTVDGFHADLRRARTASQNIIPTSTGAALTVGEIIPDLKGRLNGLALRVPTPVVSVCDVVALLKKKATPEEIHAAFEEASKGRLHGVLGLSYEPLVSSDYRRCELASVVDALSTQVMGGTLAKVLAWYDNEWGYVRTLVRLVEKMAKQWS